MPPLFFQQGYGWVDAGIHPQEFAGGNDDEGGVGADVACAIGIDGIDGDWQWLIRLEEAAEAS